MPVQQRIIEAFDDPVLILDDARISAANAAMRALLGDAIVGRDLRVAIRHPEAIRAIIAGDARTIDIIGIGGAERPWSLSVRPIGNKLVLVRLHDRAAAVAAERMRVDFVANASHELRTPLATISGYAETLADEDVPPSLRKKFANTISTEAARMLRIVQDLMSLSRIEADRFRLPREKVDLTSLARQAIEQIAPLSERRECPVSLELQADDIRVDGDRGQLLQALDNLLSNAIRYGATPGTSVSLIIGTEHGRPFVRVTDQGRGIAAEHVSRLTERFYRVDNARSRDSGGTGLGLAIVKHIAERHRGELAIRSAVGHGTNVTITFPAT